jgi:hypothetical protein
MTSRVEGKGKGGGGGGGGALYTSVNLKFLVVNRTVNLNSEDVEISFLIKDVTHLTRR